MSRSSLCLSCCTLIAFATLSLAAAAQTTWSNIDDYALCSGGVWAGCWQSSGTLGGGNGATVTGPTPTLNPSLDGSSAQFTVAPTSASYGNGLWWANTICCVANVSAGYFNFRYDLYFYITQPNLAQALEFDVNQTISNPSAGTSVRYVFGTQCNHLQNGHWQVWHEGDGWSNTYVPCSMPMARWNHVIWELQRTSSGQVYFISLTFNGQKYYVNKKFGPRQLNVLADDLNIAFQMDSKSSGAGYATWLDKVTLTAW